MIHPAVADHLDEIIEICKEYGVARLELFGSAVNDEFDPARSDIDFLIEYPDGYDAGHWGSRYAEFEDRLREVLGRDVDLVTMKWQRNPYLIHSIEQSRHLFYAA
ncbi:MAG: nucleotidyltransferase domain-containing protein [Thermomicrobiales bacterium]|nr:nucleotidyltransferase domain-containing protein [Thermomicrobiales bacterium]